MRGSHGDQRLVARARALRVNSTDAERRVWGRLRGRRLAGHKFVRQYSIGPYVADFICRERWLIVELDGSQHLESLRDIARDRYLNELGYGVLRVWNNEALTNTDGVLEAIAHLLEGNDPSPGWRYSPATLSAERREAQPARDEED